MVGEADHALIMMPCRPCLLQRTLGSLTYEIGLGEEPTTSIRRLDPARPAPATRRGATNDAARDRELIGAPWLVAQARCP